MSETLIRVEGLYKKFTRDLKHSLVYGTTDTFKSIIGVQYPTNRLRKKEFWALQNINFKLNRGEVLGLIGKNGCGKSTLLRLLTGIFPPDMGKIEMKGRIGALIAVGAGFHPHMTGRENIFLNGTLLGLSRSEIKKRFFDIVEFSEIESFIDAPVATYSSGMRVRLGFSIAIHTNPDILLIDEVLSVGDQGFRIKSLNRINDLLHDTAIVFVSHNMPQISKISTKIILLENGKIEAFSGNKQPIIDRYLSKFNPENSIISENNRLKLTGFKVYSDETKENIINCYSDLNIKLNISSSYPKINKIGIVIKFLNSEHTIIGTYQSGKIDFFSEKTLKIFNINFESGNYYINIFLLEFDNIKESVISYYKYYKVLKVINSPIQNNGLTHLKSLF